MEARGEEQERLVTGFQLHNIGKHVLSCYGRTRKRPLQLRKVLVAARWAI